MEQEKKRRLSSNRELEKQQQKLQNELEAMAGSKVALERNVRAYDEDRQWQLPEPGVVQSAKVYREKVALPLITRLKELVKNLTIKCVGLMEQVKKLTAKVNQQERILHGTRIKSRSRIAQWSICRRKRRIWNE